MAELDLGALSYTMKLKKDGSWKSGFNEASDDIDNYQDKIKEADKANETFEDSMKKFTGSLQITGTNFDNLDKKLKLWILSNRDSSNDIEKNSKVIETNKEKMAELSNQLEKGNALLKQVKSSFGQNSEQYKKAENSVLDLQIAYKKVEAETKNLEDSNEEMKKSMDPSFFDTLKEKISNAMSGIGQSIKNGIGMAIGRDIWSAFKDGATTVLTFGSSYQKAMNQVQATTGFANHAMGNLRQSMIDIYNDNFGEDFNDIGDALQTVAQQWKGNTNEIKGLTEGALALRETFDFDVNESFRSANMLITQFGMSGDEAYSMIAQGAQRGLDKNGDLLDSINEYSVQFKGLGLNAEDMFNMLQNGAASGTFSVDKLGDAVKEFGIRAKDGSKSTEEAFQALGLNVQDTEQKFAKGGDTAKQAFQQINEKLLGLKDPLQQNQIGTALWGTMWEDLGKSGIQSLTNMQGDIEKTGEALNDIKKIKYNDLGTAFEGIKRNLQTGILLPISNEILPKLSDFSNWFVAHMPEIKENVTSAVNAILPIFDALGKTLIFAKDNANWLVPAILGVTASFGAFQIISTVNTLMKAWRATTFATTLAQQGLNAALRANPIGLVITAIGLLVAAAVLIYKNWGPISTFFKNLWDGIKNAFNSAIAAIKDAWNSIVDFFKDIGQGISDAWHNAGTSLQNTWDSITQGLSNGINAIASFFSNLPEKILSSLSSLGSTISNFFSGAWDEIKGIFSNAITSVVEYINTNFGGVVQNLQSIWHNIQQIFLAGVDLIKTIIMGPFLLICDLITGLFTGSFEQLKADAQGIWSNITNDILAFWYGIQSIFHSALDIVKTLFLSVWNNIVTTAKNIWSSFSTFMSNLWNGIKNTAISMWNSLKNTVVSIITGLVNGAVIIFNRIISFFRGLPGTLSNLASSAFNAVRNAFVSIGNAAVNAAINIFNRVVNFFRNLPGTLYSAGVSAFNALKNGVSSAISGIYGIVSSGFNSAIEFITSLPSKAWTWGADFVQGIVNGIGDSVHKVVDKVSALAAKIRSYLHFSVPDEGPLTDYESWMPDFLGGLAKGIEDNKNLVTNAIKNLATDVNVGMQLNPALAGNYIGDMPNRVNNGENNDNSSYRDIHITNPIYLDSDLISVKNDAVLGNKYKKSGRKDGLK